MSIPITMDGVEYPNIHVVSIKRSFQVLDGENAGRVMTGEMDRDIIGTYYNYSCEIDASAADRAEYDEFYEAISAPVDSHEIVMPYAQQTISFSAYVTNGEDELLSMFDDNEWGNLSFNFIAMAPQRRPAE